MISIAKKDIVSLISAWSANDSIKFKEVTYNIIKRFDENGDYELAEYILAQVSEDYWIPQ